jgi:hypothetical protein
MRKINLAKELKAKLVSFINENRNSLYVPNGLTVEELLSDDDNFSDWLNYHWSVIKEYDMLVVRDFMTWSYLMDTESQTSFELEYFFDESI